MDNSLNHFFFKYRDKSVNIENINDIVFDINLVETIHVIEDQLSYYNGDYKDQGIPAYTKEIDKLFLDNINNIEFVFEKYSRIDEDPIFKSVLNYNDPDLKEKIKSGIRIDRIDKFLNDEDGQ